MTRKQIEQEWDVKDDFITNPGQFEMEPVYAPHFYEVYLTGFVDDLNDNSAIIGITADDRKEFPELENAVSIRLIFTDDGFIICQKIYR